MAIPSLVDPPSGNLPSTRHRSAAALLSIYYLYCCWLIGNSRVFALVFLKPSVDHRSYLLRSSLVDRLYLHLLELRSTCYWENTRRTRLIWTMVFRKVFLPETNEAFEYETRIGRRMDINSWTEAGWVTVSQLCLAQNYGRASIVLNW